MLAKTYNLRYDRAMRNVGDTFFGNLSGPFSGQVFHQCDTDYNLDYVDSNGQRHRQLLADYDFSKTPDTPLIKSQLHYFPAEAASEKDDDNNDNLDYFVGQVESEPPRHGRQNIKKLSLEMRQQLKSMMRLKCEIDAYYDPEEDSATIFLTDEASDELIAISVKTLKQEDDSLEETIQYHVVLSSDPEQPLAQRHFDAMLSAELWTFLHNFGSTVGHSPAGKHLQDATTTLKVGLERTPDACRFGLALLEGLAAFDDLEPEEPAPRIAPKIKYEELDTRFQSYSDDTLRQIVRRAIVLAYRSKKPIAARSLLESVRFEQALASIVDE